MRKLWLRTPKSRLRSIYGNEIDLVKGKNIPVSEQTSIIYFTTERAASRFVSTILKQLSDEAGLLPIEMTMSFS